MPSMLTHLKVGHTEGEGEGMDRACAHPASSMPSMLTHLKVDYQEGLYILIEEKAPPVIIN